MIVTFEAGSKTSKVALKLTFANFTPHFATILAHKCIKSKQFRYLLSVYLGVNTRFKTRLKHTHHAPQ